MKRLFALLTTLFFFSLIAAIVVGFLGYGTYQKLLEMPANANQSTVKVDNTFVFPRGSSVEDLLEKISEQQPELGNVEQQVLRLGLYLTGQSRQLKAGRYAWSNHQSEPSYTIGELVSHVVAGEVVEQGITIAEGQTFADMRAAVAAIPNISHTTTNLSDQEILAQITTQFDHPEGLFLANTYFYDDSSTDMDIYRKAYNALEDTLAQEWENRAQGLEVTTPYEALILASIIEKETGVSAERAKVSGVFHRRLAVPMRLQTDPTVIYGLGEDYTGQLKQSHLAKDTPYNTYTRDGLTPTPIALVGEASIRAALHPDNSKALYFVADGKGGHRFAETLEGHNANVKRYRETQ